MSSMMEKLRRLRQSVSTIQPRVFVETTVRLALASIVNFYLSRFIFSYKLIPTLENAFQATPLAEWLFFQKDPDRLPKMYRLWPPHAYIELAAVFTVTLYILLKYFMIPEHVWQLLGRRDRRDGVEGSDQSQRPCSALVARLLSAGVVAFAVFVLLLPMQRLAEMHIFVIALNFFHVLLICELSAAIMFLFTNYNIEKLKEE